MLLAFLRSSHRAIEPLTLATSHTKFEWISGLQACAMAGGRKFSPAALRRGRARGNFKLVSTFRITCSFAVVGERLRQ